MPRIWPCRLEKGGTILHPCLTIGPTPPPLDLDHHLHAGETSTSTRSSRAASRRAPTFHQLLASLPTLDLNLLDPPGPPFPLPLPTPAPLRAPPPTSAGSSLRPGVRGRRPRSASGGPRCREGGPPARTSSCSKGLSPATPKPASSGPSVSYPFRRDDRSSRLSARRSERPGDPARGRPSGARAAPRRVPGGPGTGAGDGPWSGVEEGTIRTIGRRARDERDERRPGWTRAPSG